MPDTAFYPLVFRHVLFLQHPQSQSQALSALSGPSDDVRSFYGQKASFTDDEVSQVLRVAQAFSAAIAPVDAQAAAMIKASRARYPGGRIAAGQDPPPVPQELYDLQARHDAIVRSHIAMLRSALGDRRFAIANKALRSVMQPSYQGRPFSVSPAPHNPTGPIEVPHD